MTSEQKDLLIKRGKESFDNGDFLKAGEYFRLSDYHTGLVEVGDHFYRQHQPLLAYGYYKKAKYTSMLDKITHSFSFALRCWMNPDALVDSLKKAGIPEQRDSLGAEKKEFTYLGRDFIVD